MCGGIAMSLAHDYQLAPAHAHLNLVGWVTMALFGTYYHLVPRSGERLMARIHLLISFAGVGLFAPGIALSILYEIEVPVSIGAVLTVTSIVMFLGTVIYDRVSQETDESLNEGLFIQV